MGNIYIYIYSGFISYLKLTESIEAKLTTPSPSLQSIAVQYCSTRDCSSLWTCSGSLPFDILEKTRRKDGLVLPQAFPTHSFHRSWCSWAIRSLRESLSSLPPPVPLLVRPVRGPEEEDRNAAFCHKQRGTAKFSVLIQNYFFPRNMRNL